MRATKRHDPQYVLHHHGLDGFAAAWAAHSALPADTVYQAMRYGEAPKVPDGARVLLLGYCYDAATLLRLAARTHLTVIDHHDTSAEQIATAVPVVEFGLHDPLHVSSVSAYTHYHPGQKAPEMLSMIEDVDLRRYEVQDSRLLCTALALYPQRFNVWNLIEASWPLLRARFLTEGGAAIRLRTRAVSSICDRSTMGTVGNWLVPIANTSVFFMETCEELLSRVPQTPFAASYCILDGGIKRWTLISRGDFDVSDVARQFGGEGSRHAASFREVPPAAPFASSLPG